MGGLISARAVLEKALKDPDFIMKAINRYPIQLKPNVKQKFDDIHTILGMETQSETVKVLIDFYRTNGMKIQV